MNSDQSQSYLDLSVLPDLRSAVLSGTPIVVFSENLDTIVWSNAAGAQLFGGTSIIELLAASLPENNPVLRQLRHATEQMGNANQIVRGIRFGRTFRSQMLQFELKRIELPQSQSGFKTTQLIDSDDNAISENVAAMHAVEALEGFADAAAIVDDHGLPIHYSSGFSELGPDEATLADLVEELKREEDRLIKRPVAAASGELAAIGLARISDLPGRSLVVIAKVSDGASQSTEDDADSKSISNLLEVRSTDLDEDTVPPVEEANTDETISISGGLVEKAAEPDTIAEETEPETFTIENHSSEEPDEPDTLAEEIEPETLTEDIDETPVPVTEPLEAGEDAPFDDAQGAGEDTREEFDSNAAPSGEEINDATYEADDGIEGEDTIHESDVESAPAPVGLSTSLSDQGEEFVRFAWSVNAETIFVSVSEELAGFVGKNPANIMGRRWQDVANVMGFDRDGQIENLLRRRDTWSGKIVHWPIEGTDKVVPIDLAALPIFNTSREFEGFKGYGKIHTNLLQDDPEAIGLAFSETSAPEELSDEDANSELEEENFTDEPEYKIDIRDTDIEELKHEENLEESHSNVLPFSRNNHAEPKSLSQTERNALKAVREHLQEEETDGDEEAPADRPQVDTSLLEKLPVAVLVYRNDDLLFANRKLLDISEYNTVEELVEAGGISALLDFEEEAEADNRQYILTKDGTKIEVNAVMQSVPWDTEKALLLSFAPPSDRENPEPDALELTRASEVQNILDTTADGIILLDENGRIISINAPAEALFGLDFDDAIGEELEFLFAAESKETIRKYVDSVLTPGFESLINDGEEAIARESGGGMIPVYLTLAKLEQSGKLCAVIRDITSWKKAEEELIQSKQTAERASELKSEFLAQVSHEIRTPLNAIIGFSDVMIEERFGSIDNERYREYLRDIRRSGVHVLDIINELLDLSKVESGKLDLTFEAVNLNEMVAETVALLQPQANANRTIIRTSLSRSVPKVVADPRSIRQIIMNLVSNAIKYSQSNSQVIVSTVYESNGEVALRVRDTGKGMTRSEIELAMKPFRQVHTVSDKNPEGTGLGLPLTKALVEANRAYFELESSPGSGTIAHVQFPMQRVLAD